MSLAILIIALVKTAHIDYVISTFCFLYSLIDKFFFRPAIFQITANDYAVVALVDVTDVATRIVAGCADGLASLFNAFER